MKGMPILIPTESKEVSTTNYTSNRELLSVTGNGFNNTDKFNLNGGTTTLEVYLSNNQVCMNAGCVDKNFSVWLVCNGKKQELLINDNVGSLEKIITLYDISGSCYLEVDSEEEATWSVIVTQK
jgi:hypothetical protein